MPSPIAHTSLALVIWPAVAPRLRDAPRRNRMIVLIATLVTLVAADVDIALGALIGRGPFVDHGGPTHSFAAAVIWAVLFATLLRFATQALRWNEFWIIGFTAYASHVVLDALTFGRGVRMFWPFIPDRFASPWPLFAGVRHSSPAGLIDHTLTIATELLFALLIWRVAAWYRERNRHGRTMCALAPRKEQSVAP